jgi:2-C-methyl-D-erythritol 4-phosphate cytidylyltransferase
LNLARSILNKSEYVIIVAAGKGTRINSTTPKQFLELCGKPILLHTVEAFINYNNSINIILVLPDGDIDIWNGIAKKYNLTKPITITKGGDTRFQSVRNGLDVISGNGFVAIHDGVRPLVSNDIISNSFKLAEENQAAVAAVPLKDSIRITEKNSSKAIDRSQFRLIQTPQTFDVQLIKKAYALKEDQSLTDDASVAERGGYKVSLFEGSYENIKITTPEDLIVAEALLKARMVN